MWQEMACATQARDGLRVGLQGVEQRSSWSLFWAVRGGCGDAWEDWGGGGGMTLLMFMFMLLL